MRKELQLSHGEFKALYGAKKELKSVLKERVSKAEKGRDEFRKALLCVKNDAIECEQDDGKYIVTQYSMDKINAVLGKGK